jgi:hypothetical protein
VHDHGPVAEQPVCAQTVQLRSRGVEIAGPAVAVAHALGDVRYERIDMSGPHAGRQGRVGARERPGLDPVATEVESVHVAGEQPVRGRIAGGALVGGLPAQEAADLGPLDRLGV